MSSGNVYNAAEGHYSTSSFDSSHSFYSTDSSSNSSSNSSLQASPKNFSVDRAEMFDARWQSLVEQKINTVLQEISRPDAFTPLLALETVKLDASTNPATPFCFRTTAVFSGQSAASAFALFACVPKRPSWDSMCESIQVLRQIDPLTFIYHLKLKATWPTSPRDSLLMAAFRRLTDGRYISVAWSIEDDSLCPPDPSGTFIRMHTRISANLLTPQGPAATTTTTAFTLNQLIDAEPKGSIPAYLIKKVSAKSLPATMQSIKDALAQSQISEEEAESFYDNTLQETADASSDFDSGESGVEDEITVGQLKSIKKRLEALEATVKLLQKQEKSQNIWKYSALTISSISLLLLLRLNLRRK